MTARAMILRGAALSGGSVLLSMAALLAVGKIATNALAPAEVAVFAIILLAADGLNLLGTLGLPVALPKLVAAAPPGDAQRLTRAAIAAAACGAGLLAAAGLALWAAFPAPPGAFEGDWRGAWPRLWWVAPLLIAGALRDTAMAALAGHNRYADRARGIVAAAAAQVALALAFVVAWPGGLGGLLAAMAAAQAAAAAVLLWPLRGAARGGPDPATRAHAARAIRFSAPLYANSLLNFVFQRVDTILLAVILADPVPVAIYEMAKRLPMVLSRTLGALLVPFLPAMAARVAAGDHAAAARLLDRALGLAAITGFAATFAAVLAREPIVLALFSADYLPATAVIGPLLGAMVVAVLTGLHGQTLIALGRPGQVTAINILTAAASLAINLALVPRWGLQGAAAAALAAATLGYALQAAAVRRAGIRVPAARAVYPLAIAGACGLLLLATGAPLPARAAALLGVLAGLIACGAARRDDLRALLRRPAA